MLALQIGILLVGLVAILAGAELFTNGLEWLGARLGLSEGLVGSVFAAVGTALPETLIPIVAVVGDGDATAREVGAGAILGAPFMLSTLTMFVTGAAIVIYTQLGRRRRTLTFDRRVIGRDVRFFLGCYAVSIAIAFIHVPVFVRAIVAVCLLFAYGFHVYQHATAKDEPTTTQSFEAEDANDELHKLFLQRKATNNPALGLIVAQIALGIGIIVGGAIFFVQIVQDVSKEIGISSLVLALIVAPIATELPEKFNSVLWVRRGKDTLAIGNITGAMVFQVCIPVAFGLVFTDWVVSADNVGSFLSAAIALGSTIIIFGLLRMSRRPSALILLLGGLFYATYLTSLFAFGFA